MEYIRESPWKGHIYGPATYSCVNCLIAQNSWFTAGECVGKPKNPPFSFNFGEIPNKKSKFCKSKHNLEKILDLRDLDMLECNAERREVGNSVFLYTVKAPGIIDKYRCSHCHKVFEDKCIHGFMY